MAWRRIEIAEGTRAHQRNHCQPSTLISPLPPALPLQAFQYLTDVTIATMGVLGARNPLTSSRAADHEDTHLW